MWPTPELEDPMGAAILSRSRPSTPNVTGFGGAQPGDRLDELGLAVPVDAGDAHDLPGANLEATRRGRLRARGRRSTL